MNAKDANHQKRNPTVPEMGISRKIIQISANDDPIEATSTQQSTGWNERGRMGSSPPGPPNTPAPGGGASAEPGDLGGAVTAIRSPPPCLIAIGRRSSTRRSSRAG